MKIVATISTRMFLAEITPEEIDFLAGRRIGRQGDYSYERVIPSGTTFNIDKAIQQVHRNTQRKREIETVRKTLEGVLNSLDIIEPFIDEPKAQEPATEPTA